jgi:hypothetical protein
MKKEIIRNVTLSGITDIMFDRYAGDNKTELTTEKKMYYMPDGKSVMLPSANIQSFLSAQNTDSAPKRFLDSREYKKVAAAFLSFITISPFSIPFTHQGKQIIFDKFGHPDDYDCKFYIDERVARLPKGIPNPKIRPVLKSPWELEFKIIIFPNDEFNEEMLYGFFEKGGIAIGFGTYRGVYGKFKITNWK